jgi:hypothetical protein
VQKYGFSMTDKGTTAVPSDVGGFYLASEVDEVLKRQAAAAIAGMNAATAISSGQVQQAHRLRAESSPEALESERQANAILTVRIAELEKLLHECLNTNENEHMDPDLIVRINRSLMGT